MPRHLGELALVLEAVGHGLELAGRIAADRREEAGRRGALGAAEPAEPGLDVRLGRAGRVEIGGLGLYRRAGDEDGVVVEPRPGTAIDQEVIEARAAERRVVLHEPQQHRLVAGPHLAHEERVGDARGLDQARERAALAFGQAGEVHANVHRREPRGHLVEPDGFRRQAYRFGRGERGQQHEQGEDGAHRGLRAVAVNARGYTIGFPG